MVWVPGHWSWEHDQYVWVGGKYMEPPPERAAWVAGRWVEQPNGYGWVEGRWD
jgi:hypothetical protein